MISWSHPSPYPNITSIGLSVFIGFRIVTKRHTDHRTSYALCSDAVIVSDHKVAAAADWPDDKYALR